MDVEMGAIYGPSMAAWGAEVARTLMASLDVDPATIVTTVLALDGDIPVGQAGLRPHGDALEVKKVIVDAEHRGRGISRMLMLELEAAARELGASTLILQTGELQPAAIGLYRSLGYLETLPYTPYELMSNSVCFEKTLPVE